MNSTTILELINIDPRELYLPSENARKLFRQLTSEELELVLGYWKENVHRIPTMYDENGIYIEHGLVAKDIIGNIEYAIVVKSQRELKDTLKSLVRSGHISQKMVNNIKKYPRMFSLESPDGIEIFKIARIHAPRRGFDNREL